MSSSTATILSTTTRRLLIRSAYRRTNLGAATATTRFISTHGSESVGRFKAALEDYRAKNYTQTIPPRFKKEITSVIQQTSVPTRRLSSSLVDPEPLSVEHQKKMAVEDIERFLNNIGALGDDKVTHEDVETIVSEFGAKEDIRADQIVNKLL